MADSVCANKGTRRGEIEPLSDSTPVELVVKFGFNARELNLIREIIEDHRNDLLEAWHEHLGR